MSKLLQDSAFFCLAISLIGYEIGIILRQKTKLALCNPLLISIVFVIIILKVTNIKYEVYEDGSSLLSYLLTPSYRLPCNSAASADGTVEKEYESYPCRYSLRCIHQSGRCMGLLNVIPSG